MSSAARETGRAHGRPLPRRLGGRVEATWSCGRTATRIDDVALETTRLRRVRGDRLQFAAVLRVKASTRRAKLGSADVRLSAVDDASGAVTELPLKVKLARRRAPLHTPAGLRGGPVVPPGTRLRLRLLWRNSAWETGLEGLDDGSEAGERQPPLTPERARRPCGRRRRGAATRRARAPGPAATA